MNELLDLDKYQSLVKELSPLTESESVLDSFIVNHFEELSYYGIIDLAQRAQVSKATIGRFLNKLGFTGYSAFKTAVKKELIANEITAPISAKKKASAKKQDTKSAAKNYVSNVSQLILQFEAQLDYQKVDELASLIADKSRQIYVVGPASSHSLALHFTTLLKYSRDGIHLLPLDKSELPKSLLGLKKKDVLIAFSYYRFNPVVLDICKYFQSKRAHVCIVTNTLSNPYSVYSSEQFILPSDADSVFHSRTVGFLFVELLLFLVQHKSTKSDNFEELERLFKFFGTFSSLEFKR